LRIDEWGDPSAPPLLLLHGAFDHGRGFDLLAPLLATRFRVLSLTSRGHGDSEWVDSYAWQNDVADAVNLLRSLGRPAHLVGHSRGGGQATDAALWAPESVRRLVNMTALARLRAFAGRVWSPGPAPPAFAITSTPRKATDRAWRPYPRSRTPSSGAARRTRGSRSGWYFPTAPARPRAGPEDRPEFAGGFGPAAGMDRTGLEVLRVPMLMRQRA
jgi:pimeloyl-ACP methyl ester carboxylesterase